MADYYWHRYNINEEPDEFSNPQAVSESYGSVAGGYINAARFYNNYEWIGGTTGWTVTGSSNTAVGYGVGQSFYQIYYSGRQVEENLIYSIDDTSHPTYTYFYVRRRTVQTSTVDVGSSYRGSYVDTIEALYDAYTHNAVNGSYWMMRGDLISEGFLLLATL